MRTTTDMSEKNYDYHNPENVPLSAIPEGWRFITEQEFKTGSLKGKLRCWLDRCGGFDDNAKYGGNIKDFTYITNAPLPKPEFRIDGPGEYVMRNGNKAIVDRLESDGNWWHGYTDFGVSTWQTSGKWGKLESVYDIIAKAPAKVEEQSDFPGGLPPLPDPPVGYYWKYRGKKWRNTKKTTFAYTEEECKYWAIRTDALPSASGHYAEAVKVETDPDYSSKEYQQSVEAAHKRGARVERFTYILYREWAIEANPEFRDTSLRLRIHPDDLIFLQSEQDQLRMEWATDPTMPLDFWHIESKKWKPVTTPPGWLYGFTYRRRKPEEPKVKSQEELDEEAYKYNVKVLRIEGASYAKELWDSALAHARSQQPKEAV